MTIQVRIIFFRQWKWFPPSRSWSPLHYSNQSVVQWSKQSHSRFLPILLITVPKLQNRDKPAANPIFQPTTANFHPVGQQVYGLHSESSKSFILRRGCQTCCKSSVLFGHKLVTIMLIFHPIKFLTMPYFTVLLGMVLLALTGPGREWLPRSRIRVGVGRVGCFGR